MVSAFLLLVCIMLFQQTTTATEQQRPQHFQQREYLIENQAQQEFPPTPPTKQRRHLNTNNNNKYYGNNSTLSLLKDKLFANYDNEIYPFSYAWRENSLGNNSNNTNSSNSTQKREGLHVATNINFHRVVQVDATKSFVDVVAWFRMVWIDPRLRWDPADYDNIDAIRVPSSKIWKPDLELWNQETSLSNSFADALAIIDPDGSITWSRPGHLRPICKFSGLEDFPFDDLGCTIEIGSWAFSGLYIRPRLFDGVGYSVGGSETAGAAYAEFDLTNISAEEHVYPPYPVSPDEDWPALFYHMVFTRAWEPYLGGYIVLQVVFNICAFACMWLPPQCGERLGLAITAMLAAVATDLTIAASLPQSSEATWVRTFAAVSLFFATSSLLENAVVIYFYYHTGDDLIPIYIKKAMQKRQEKAQQKELEENNTAKIARLQSIVLHMDDSSRGAGGEQSDNNDNNSMSAAIINDNLLLGMNNNSSQGKSSVKFQDDNDEMSTSNDTSMMLNHLQSRKSKMFMFQDKYSSTFRGGDKIFGRDADAFKNESEQENNAKWQRVAANVDHVSRVVFPAMFVAFLAERFAKTY